MQVKSGIYIFLNILAKKVSFRAQIIFIFEITQSNRKLLMIMIFITVFAASYRTPTHVIDI